MYPLNLTIVTISNYRAHPPEGSDSSNHYAQVFYVGYSGTALLWTEMLIYILEGADIRNPTSG